MKINYFLIVLDTPKDMIISDNVIITPDKNLLEFKEIKIIFL